jgi:hypothetical protein
MERLMPGGAGKARHSCPLCKPYKFAGNTAERRHPNEIARAPGATRSERRREAQKMADE